MRVYFIVISCCSPLPGSAVAHHANEEQKLLKRERVNLDISVE